LSGFTAKVIVTDANHFTLLNPIDDSIDTTTFGTFISGTCAKVYEIASPYLADGFERT
jgi:hypothetical protein